jgi:hypothetical protein
VQVQDTNVISIRLDTLQLQDRCLLDEIIVLVHMILVVGLNLVLENTMMYDKENPLYQIQQAYRW